MQGVIAETGYREAYEVTIVPCSVPFFLSLFFPPLFILPSSNFSFVDTTLGYFERCHATIVSRSLYLFVARIHDLFSCISSNTESFLFPFRSLRLLYFIFFFPFRRPDARFLGGLQTIVVLYHEKIRPLSLRVSVRDHLDPLSAIFLSKKTKVFRSFFFILFSENSSGNLK